MITRTYKNNNVTVRLDEYDPCPYEGHDKIWFGMNEFVDFLTNGVDGPDVQGVHVDDYPFWDLILYVNGAPRVYYISRADAQAFASGRTVRLVWQYDQPLFTLPEYHDFYDTTRNGVKGTVFVLSYPVTEEARADMLAAGCLFGVRSCAQAPEILHDFVFVPERVAYEYA